MKMGPARTKRFGSKCRWVYSCIGVVVVVPFWVSNLKQAHVGTQVEGHADFLVDAPFLTGRRYATADETISLGTERVVMTDGTKVHGNFDRKREPLNDSTKDKTEPNFHIVFSTGCNAFQDWQSYVFFHQVWKSGQSGHVTRVASGCMDETEADELKRAFAEQILTIPTGADRFHLHLTPDFSTTVLPGTIYKFFNKPCGLRHWMEQGLGFPANLSNYKDVVFIILDPDQIILQPFTTTDFGNDPTARWYAPAGQQHRELALTEGKPFSQLYLLGAGWVHYVKVDVQRVVRAALNATGSSTPVFDANDRSSSHLYNWTAKEVEQSYVAGPPYIAVASDMYHIVATWAAVVAPVYELTREHLSEMYAYSTAAAHLQLPHQLATSFMVSHPSVNKGEGWAMVDELEPEQVCQHVNSDSANSDNVARRAVLPHILHYCQRYFLGPYFFSKYKLPNTFLSCEHPLMLDPAEEGDSVLKYDSSVTPDGTVNQLSPVDRKRHAFFLCHIIAKVNEAAAYWKEQHCKAGAANFSKVFVFPKDQKRIGVGT